MTTRSTTVATRTFIALAIALFALGGFGCGSDNNSGTIVGQFTASSTTPALHLIKLLPQSNNGARVVVQAVVYGPDTNLDMYTFAFDVTIGDATVLAFVPGSAAAGNALQACAGETIAAIAGPDAQDPTHIVVSVSKLGQCAGNGVAGNSAVVLSLAFDALREGTSALAIAAAPAPSVLDSNGDAIPALTFDAAAGTVTAVSTGGGGY